MNKPFALLTALVIAVTMLISCSTAAYAKDEFVIPMNLDINFSNNLTVHLSQIIMSNITYGGAYSPDPINSIWPVLVLEYENHDKIQVACRFHVKITDNTSTVPKDFKYDKTEDSIYQPLYPGKKSSPVMLEFAMPKDRILTNLSIIDDGTKEVVAKIPIVYPTPTPLATPTPALGIFDEGNENMRNLMIIPILLGLAGLIGWFMARKRLF